jgi:hypothetical protein
MDLLLPSSHGLATLTDPPLLSTACGQPSLVPWSPTLAFPSRTQIRAPRVRSPRAYLYAPDLPSLNPSPQPAIDDPFPLTGSALAALRVMEPPSSYVAAAGLKRKNPDAAELERPPSAFQPVALGYTAAADERREMDFFKREKRERSEAAAAGAAALNDLSIMKDDLTINVRRR